MTSAQVVQMSVNVITNSPSQDYTHPDDHTSLTYDITKWRIFPEIVWFILTETLNKIHDYAKYVLCDFVI